MSIKKISKEQPDKFEFTLDNLEKARKAIKKYPHHNLKFANGGDRNDKSTPEALFCEKNKVETLWGIGGNDKSNSSSWILKKWQEKN